MRQSRGANNFDLLRLLAAVLVVFSHSIQLTQSVGTPPELLHEPVGEPGVVAFFAISGFLVARSWAYDPSPLSFAVKRALRLLPALILSVLVTALVLGPLVTTLSTGAYLGDPATKAFVLDNATFQTNVELPGVFAETPLPVVVNGPLWTLPLELKAYCLVLVLGLLGVLGRRRLLMPLIAILLVLLSVDALRDAIPFGDRAVATLANIQAPREVLVATRAGVYQAYPRLLAAFAIGASLFALARWVPLRWSVAGALLASWAVAIGLGGASVVPAATAALLPYLVLLLAYRATWLPRLPARMGDYSYGLYIFAFPIQQTVMLWLAPSSAWVAFAVATPIALALAVASWHFVEAPALSLKQWIRQPLERAGAAAIAHPLERVALQPDEAAAGDPRA